MRQESTGKSDPERARASEPADPEQKRGFFAAAGARLKRVIGRTEPAPAAPSELPVAAVEASENAQGEAEVSTSVQARARELLLQDRARGSGRTRAGSDEANPDADLELAPDADSEERARRTSPPPLPSQRMAASAGVGAVEGDAAAAEQLHTGVTAIPPKRAARVAAKRPLRDSKSEALRARLGAAKAALAEAQAKRTESELAALADAAAAELQEPLAASTAADSSAQPEAAERAEQQPTAAADSSAQPEAAEREVTLEQADLEDAEDDPEIELLYETEYEADDSRAEAADAEAALAPTAAANSGEAGAHAEDGTEPIRTLTIARLLARQGYFERSLSIYDELLAANASDPELRAEAEKVRIASDPLRAEAEKVRTKKRTKKRTDRS